MGTKLTPSGAVPSPLSCASGLGLLPLGPLTPLKYVTPDLPPLGWPPADQPVLQAAGCSRQGTVRGGWPSAAHRSLPRTSSRAPGALFTADLRLARLDKSFLGRAALDRG